MGTDGVNFVPRMRPAALLACCAILVIGCEHVTETPPRGPFRWPGVYVLQTINGEHLPAQALGTDILLSDSLVLTADYTFAHFEELQSDSVVADLESLGEFVGGIGPDSLIHISMLQKAPTSAIFQAIITKDGTATLVVSPFTFVFEKR
jgi:hypothetical protein